MDSLFSNIEPFLRVAEAGSFRKAAQQLGVTPPAVSKAIARLEARLGATLLSRTTRRVALTAEGDAFLERCRRAAREIEAGRADLAESRETMSGELTVTAPFILGRFLASRLAAFMDEHRELIVRLMVTDQRIDLLGEHVDVAIRIGEPGEADLVARKLARLDWVMVASPSYLKQHGVPRQAADLSRHRCLAFVLPAGDVVPWRLMSGARQVDVPVRPSLLVDEGELLVEAALGGIGIAQLFSFMVAQPLDDGRLHSVLDGIQAVGPDLKTVMTAGRSANLRVRALLDFLYRCFREL